MQKPFILFVSVILLLTSAVGCGLLSPKNLVSSRNNLPYPRASDDAKIIYQLQSNKPRTHFFIDGKEMGVARHLKVYINNNAHTVTAQAEGCIGKEEYVQPPYNSIAPLAFTYLMGECNNILPITISGTLSEQEKVESKTNVTINMGDKTPPEINIINYQLRKVFEIDQANETIYGQAIDKHGVRSVRVNNKDATLDKNGYFSSNIFLKVGLNVITIIAEDSSGNITKKHLKLKRLPTQNNKHPSKETIKSPSTVSTKVLPSTFGRYFALVIGNNDYQFVPKLDTAVNDAEEVAQVLKKHYGFSTRILLNANRKKILDTINEFKLKLDTNDNFVIYYAGHGVKDGSAYWLPVNARRDSTTEWIQAETITTELKKFNSNHVLIISDSCYSGELSRDITPINKQGKRDFYLKKLFSKKSRTLIASGGNEPVSDGGGGNHSIFSKAFIEALKNAPDSLFTDDELFNNDIKENVGGNSEQTPQYSALRNSGHENGSFIFFKIR